MQLQVPVDPRLFIAVIDDSLTVRKTLETILKREGYVVVSFATPLEAFRAFLNPEPQFPLPNILFVDIRLPQFDGYEVMRRFREVPGGKDIHIIVVTKLTGVIDKVKANLAKANDYLTKPFKEEQIRAAVHTYLEAH